MEQKMNGGDVGRRAAALHPRGDRREDIRHFKTYRNSYKLQLKRKKQQPTNANPAPFTARARQLICVP